MNCLPWKHADTLPRLESTAVMFKMWSHETKVSTRTVGEGSVCKRPIPRWDLTAPICFTASSLVFSCLEWNFNREYCWPGLLPILDNHSVLIWFSPRKTLDSCSDGSWLWASCRAPRGFRNQQQRKLRFFCLAIHRTIFFDSYHD